MKRIRILGVIAGLALAGCGNLSKTQAPQGKPLLIERITAEDPDVRVGAGIHLTTQLRAHSETTTYEWRTSHGIISRPYDKTTLWIAPASVPYSPYPVTIWLTVRDAYGREAEGTSQITVYQ